MLWLWLLLLWLLLLLWWWLLLWLLWWLGSVSPLSLADADAAAGAASGPG